MTAQQFGAEVVDKNGRSLGKIDYIIRDSWSGDIKKYIIYRQRPDEDISFSPDDISETTESNIKLNIVIE
jgi:sporulation protein YlmC with PRC-barrel domain